MVAGEMHRVRVRVGRHQADGAIERQALSGKAGRSIGAGSERVSFDSPRDSFSLKHSTVYYCSNDFAVGGRKG